MVTSTSNESEKINQASRELKPLVLHAIRKVRRYNTQMGKRFSNYTSIKGVVSKTQEVLELNTEN